jgi:hypothetical protein
VQQRETSFEGERAPCGRLVRADRSEVDDEDGLVMALTVYACGCRSLHREFHDGSFQRQVIRHDGKRFTLHEMHSER